MDGLIGNLSLKDIDQVLEIQKACYSEDYLESRDKFESILKLYPQGCFGLWRGALVAYLFSHPWRLGEYVPLDTPLERLPDGADCLYAHDIAILPEHRGEGVGRALFSRVLDLAKRERFRAIELVSVQHSEGFCKELGFREVRDMVYGGRAAKFMIMDLP